MDFIAVSGQTSFSKLSSTKMTSLSIIIPSYDRREQLAKTLSIIIPQALAHKVSILILDNASPSPVEQLVRDFPDAGGIVKVVRNAFNVGANANICRCFESCETEWMWMLSDDDAPAADAVGNILEEIKGVDAQCCMINFRSDMISVGKRDRIVDLADVSRHAVSKPWINNLVFISSSVFRIAPARAHLRDGYHYAYSCAPHLIMTFLAVAGGCHIIDSDKLLVEVGKADENHHWNVIPYFLGLTSLADHPRLRSLSQGTERRAILGMRGTIFQAVRMVSKGAFTCPVPEIGFWSGFCFRLAASAPVIEALVLSFFGLCFRGLWILGPLRSRLVFLLGFKRRFENTERL